MGVIWTLQSLWRWRGEYLWALLQLQLRLLTMIFHFRFGCSPVVDQSQEVRARLEESQTILQEHLSQGSQIYGKTRLRGGWMLAVGV